MKKESPGKESRLSRCLVRLAIEQKEKKRELLRNSLGNFRETKKKKKGKGKKNPERHDQNRFVNAHRSLRTVWGGGGRTAPAPGKKCIAQKKPQRGET